MALELGLKEVDDLMRVLMVTPSYYPVKGGAETVVRNLSTKLNETGVQTDIMTFNMNRKWNPSWQGRIEKIDGVKVFKIPAFNWFPMVHSDRITMKINLIPGRFRNRLKKYDIIHFHGNDLTFPLFSYTVNKPKLFQFHALPVDFYKKHLISRLILKHTADIYLSVSKLMRRQLMGLDIAKNKIRYLPNPVDTNFFHPAGEKEDNLILFVGRITIDKGLHVLLRSLAFVEKTVRLVIIGSEDWPPEYYWKIISQIEKQNKEGRHKVIYLGAQDRADVVKWYQKAAIFVLPSFREALGVVNLEALSCETPVISTNVGGIPEAVRDGKNGILIPPNNAAELAQALQYLLDNEDVRIRFGREGRMRVMENYSSDIVVEKLCGIYEELIASYQLHARAHTST